MTGYSPLETALAATGEALQRTQLGNDLERFAPGRRDGGRGGGNDLAGLELSLGVPVQRTLKTMATLKGFGHRIDLSGDEDYLAWVWRLHAFARAVNAKAWQGIPAEYRTTFVDWDDVPEFAVEDYISHLREAHPPDLLTTAARIGVAPDQLRSVSELAAACRATPAYEAARSAARRARDVRHFLDRQRERYQEQRGRFVLEPLPLDESVKRIRSVMDGIVKGRNEFERALSTFNRLVNRSIGGMLSWAERHPQLPPVDPLDYPIAVEVARRSLRIHVTAPGEYWMLKTGAPFELKLNGPLDGIYFCDSYSMRIQGNEAMADLHGLRLKDLEAAP